LLGDVEACFHFVRATECDLVMEALIAGGAPRAFAEVEYDARSGALQLIGEIGVVLLDRWDDVAQ